MVWVRLAQPAQQALLKSHKISNNTITPRGEIRGEFVVLNGCLWQPTKTIFKKDEEKFAFI
jgi:hypothetical protein